MFFKYLGFTMEKNMSHICEAVLVTCEDFRLHQRADGRNYTAEFMRGLNMDCDLITRGGCIQDIVRPQLGFDNSLLRDLGVSVKLHDIKTIYLIGHEDCGAYGDFNFTERKIEFQQHFEDLEEAKEIIHAEFPTVEVKKYFAELEPGTVDRFIYKEVK